ncbi:hypothetical protein IKE67_09440 [bacterium]|nr:hypothetical protein [bacterium]
MKKRTVISMFLTVISAFLTHKFWLSANTFNFYLFISISVLSFLLFYKISNYLADFKSVKNKSVAEILFLIIFFIVLFIPMSNIDNSEISEQENRTLAKLKPIFTKQGKINYDFGKNFNDWFNDHFNFRNKLIALNSYLKISTNKDVEIKQDGFIDKESGFIYYYRNFYRYSSKEVQNNLKPLIELNNFCKQNNIKLYVLITPPKEDIYKPKSSIIAIKDNTPFEKYIQQLQKNTDLKIFYPINEFKENAKNNYIYFKTDDHWTDDGAYTGYKVLMDAIQKDFTNINVLTPNDFEYLENNLIRTDWDRKFGYGRTATKLGIFNLDKYHTTKYRYYKHKNFNALKTTITDINLHREKDYFYPKGANYKVILLGTSQNENLTEFIPFTFKNVKRIRTNNVKGISQTESTKIMKYHKKDILEYKPNILIFCVTYNNLSTLPYFFKD